MQTPTGFRETAIPVGYVTSYSNDIEVRAISLSTNPHPTTSEGLAQRHGRLQPADLRNSAMDVLDEPREVAMRSLATAEYVAQSPDVIPTRLKPPHGHSSELLIIRSQEQLMDACNRRRP